MNRSGLWLESRKSSIRGGASSLSQRLTASGLPCPADIKQSLACGLVSKSTDSRQSNSQISSTIAVVVKLVLRYLTAPCEDLSDVPTQCLHIAKSCLYSLKHALGIRDCTNAKRTPPPLQSAGSSPIPNKRAPLLGDRIRVMMRTMPPLELRLLGWRREKQPEGAKSTAYYCRYPAASCAPRSASMVRSASRMYR